MFKIESVKVLKISRLLTDLVKSSSTRHDEYDESLRMILLGASGCRGNLGKITGTVHR